MASGCSRISRLCLDSCPNIAGSGLIAVTEANPGIRHLSLSLNSGFSDEAAAQAIFWLKRVRLVNFAGCPRLHRLLPSALAKNCELLEDLSLAGCTLLRDEALRCLLISCPHLESLNLSKCPCLTAAPFLEVLPMMRSRLRRLCLTHVPAISEQAVSAIYSAAAAGAGGDGTFDSRALVAALQAASYEEEDEDEDGDDRSDDDGDDEDPAASTVPLPHPFHVLPVLRSSVLAATATTMQFYDSVLILFGKVCECCQDWLQMIRFRDLQMTALSFSLALIIH
ncbi:unnamed protein product [Polarella glacialis]|uniref:Uncharacterized protein n=1 Tax=Polarella glacialis TaxID=89957 RepID=A0A813EYW5_POLGL|nr:unnamed protein product [Polarella glacialis]